MIPHGQTQIPTNRVCCFCFSEEFLKGRKKKYLMIIHGQKPPVLNKTYVVGTPRNPASVVKLDARPTVIWRSRVRSQAGLSTYLCGD